MKILLLLSIFIIIIFLLNKKEKMNEKINNIENSNDNKEIKFKIVNNDFRFKYCQITNHLLNTGDVLRINATRLYFNRLYFRKKLYFVSYIEWSKPVFNKCDLEISVVNVSENGKHFIKFIIPVNFTDNVNLTQSKGINNIIHSTDHIPYHKYGVWNKGNIVIVNLNNLCFMFN